MGCSAPTVKADQDQNLRTSVKAITELLAPQLKTAKTDWKKALILRDLVHRHSVVNPQIPVATNEDLADLESVFRKSLVERSLSNACNGLAILYVLALRAHGIEARNVFMYSSRKASNIVWSHATVDVRIDGAWVALDPTVNASLRDGAGKPLSWPDALLRAHNGQSVLVRTEGYPIKPNRSWSEIKKVLGYDLADWHRQYILGPSVSESATLHGKDWDGRIHYADGRVFDAWKSGSSSFYLGLVGG